jgi:hypothetical protein
VDKCKRNTQRFTYKDNGEIEEVEFLENLEAISCNVEVYSDEENEKNKDYSK